MQNQNLENKHKGKLNKLIYLQKKPQKQTTDKVVLKSHEMLTHEKLFRLKKETNKNSMKHNALTRDKKLTLYLYLRRH